MKIFKHAAVLSFSLLWIPLTYADWNLNNDRSTVAFVTTKAIHIAEVNQFDRLQGKIADSGAAELVIDLSSVNTAIPIRDERLQEHLFEVSTFPKAVVSAQVDVKAVNKLKVGETIDTELAGALDLHGVKLPINVPVTIVKQSKDSFLAISKKPLILNASAVDLATGVEKLREIAGLPNIGYSVSVTFQLAFSK